MSETFPTVPVKDVSLGNVLQLTGAGRKRRVVNVQQCLYYVSIRDTVDALLKHSNLLDYLTSDCSQSSDLLNNFCDGLVHHQHPLFSREKLSLQVILYYDDVQLCNPLGSRTTFNKLGFFYVSFVNLPIEIRSRLKSIFLLCIVKVNYILKYGYDAVLQAFFKEMQTFSNSGFTFKVGTSEIKLYGYLALVVADTLAAHQLLGFKEGVGFANKKCRNCMTNFSQMQTNFSETDFEPRTLQLHESHCSELERDARASVEYGVNRRSSFFNLLHFDPLKCFPHDVMHILLEGCVPYTLKHLLAYYVENGLFSLDDLNEKVRSFPYCTEDLPNKPTMIHISHLRQGRLHQSASQMWLLARLLPFYIGRYIDMKDDMWQCFVLLLKIISTVLSPYIAKDQLENLKLDVNFHLQLFKRNFKEANIIPKQHYMVHIATNIANIGPPVGYWAMRFEAKHSYFKRISRNAGYKNLCKELALRHQWKFSMDLLQNDIFRSECVEGPSKEVMFSDFSAAEQVVLNEHNVMADTESIKIHKWIKLQGILYKSSSFVISDCHDDLPLFGEIRTVASIRGQLMCIIQMYDTVGVEESFNSYLVTKTSKVNVVWLTDLHIPQTFVGYYHDMKCYIVIKHDVTALVA